MVRTFGKLPKRWWNTWAARGKYFEEDGSFKVISGKSSERSRTVDLGKRLGDLLQRGKVEIGKEELEMLERMLVKMTKYEPQDRIGSEELLKDGWFTMMGASSRRDSRD